MRKGSKLKSFEVYKYSALLACYATYGVEGFRPAQFKFFIELLSNWMSSFFKNDLLEVQNTQVIRELDSMVKQSVLRKEVGVYLVNPAGLIEALNHISHPAGIDKLETFYFKIHFLTFYKDKFFHMVTENRSTLPSSTELALKHLLDPKNLLESQKKLLDEEIQNLEKRINENKKQISYTKSLLNENLPLDIITHRVSERFPYELDYQKSMKELFANFSPDLKAKELIEAPKSRIETLWNPTLNYLKDFRRRLEIDFSI